MVILKKIVIMTEHNKSNCSGIVKFENFAGRTSCFIRILGLNTSGVICIKCGDDVMYCGDVIDGARSFHTLYDLNKFIQIVVVADGSIVCMGSNRGRFSPNAIMNDVHRYFVSIAEQPTERTAAVTMQTQSTIEKPSAEDIKVESAQAEERQAVNQRLIEKKAIEKIDETPTQTQSSQQSKKVVNAKTSEPFYKKIEKNLSELFEKHQKDEELTLLINNSKWARVPIDGDGFYVVGVIENDGTPEIICYGVPDKDDSNPPQNSSDCRQWMEIEKGGRGYWMMYQSAISGATLTTSII